MTLTTAYINRYMTLFNSMVIKAEKQPEINAIVSRINAGMDRYKNIQAQTHVPWFFIGVIHYLEANCNFSKHLHNGDPLTARTVQVPAGRPLTGKPPFTWEESALDALRHGGLDKVSSWTIPQMLFLLEGYNGFGYLQYHPNVNSPYLWSYSNHYTKGKYGADRVYNPNLVSKQAGAAVILKTVMIKNNLITAAVAAGGRIITAALILFGIFLFKN